MDTAVITLTIPSTWLEGVAPSEDILRQAIKLGLDQLRQQKEDNTRVVQALQRTGRVNRLILSTDSVQDKSTSTRQTPPTIPGPAVSDILIAQRHGEQ